MAHPSAPPDAAPRAIRTALTGREAEDFDSEYRRALAEAAETLDLNPVLDLLRRWQRVAWSTRDDPEAHRRMLETAAALLAGHETQTKPWAVTKASLEL